MKIKHIAIIGLGLIGASLAKALKAHGYYIIGIDKKGKILKLAKKEKVINEGYTKLSKQALKNIDLIFIATPLSTIPFYIQEIAKLVEHKIILTDTGSTKSDICKLAKKVLPKNITFLGGHPMAGTEKIGFEYSDKNLFKNCVWLLTPTSKNSKQLEKIIRQIGAKALTLNPEEHDKAVALISHMPLLASIALCETVRNIKDKKLRKLAEAIASSGFRDTTRIAGGNPGLNLDLIKSNNSNLKIFLTNYQKELQNILKSSKLKPKKLFKKLNEVSKWRNRLYKIKGLK